MDHYVRDRTASHQICKTISRLSEARVPYLHFTTTCKEIRIHEKGCKFKFKLNSLNFEGTLCPGIWWPSASHLWPLCHVYWRHLKWSVTAWSHPNSRVEDHRLELTQLRPAPNSHPVPRTPPQHGQFNKRAAKGTQVVCNFIGLWGDPHTNKQNSSSVVNKATHCTSISPDSTVEEKNIFIYIYIHWHRIPAHPRWYPATITQLPTPISK